ncbi:LptA/OstA family protein [Deinococcus sp. KNUC1210]|uniref:LptA/OstA family protein n=1 Tax=Deinococcus sp. KNUC1210 TaxID=2917691 RepID=UPI001EF032D1|nr:LptA/OstA family protein [Deinococcus sp. KNUC1210]ULH15242.1 LptA/OstA family protein [Deinococcus sp. KNUC1210]
MNRMHGRTGVRRFGLASAVLLLGLALAQSDGTPPVVQPQPPVVSPPPTSPPPASPPAASPEAPAPDTGTADTGEGSSVSLTRTAKDGSKRLIRVVRTGTSDETGIFVACQPLDDDPPGTPTLSVFSESGAGGVRVSIDKNEIVAPLAVVTQKDGGDGHIEVSAGTARFLDDVPTDAAGKPKTDQLSRCEVEATPQATPDTVNVTQGKTRLKGSKLTYDDSDGVAYIDGPITFSRQNQDSTLTGSSAKIEVNVDDQTTTLVGSVTLKDGDRTSSAERVEYDDAGNIAILRGTPQNPATSVTADQRVTASVIRYNLDTGSVVALGPIGGEFQDSAATPAPTTTEPGTTPAPPPAP